MLKISTLQLLTVVGSTILILLIIVYFSSGKMFDIFKSLFFYFLLNGATAFTKTGTVDFFLIIT